MNPLGYLYNLTIYLYMKKKFTIILCLAFCFFFSMNAFAAEVVTVGSLKYELNGTEAYITGYVGEPTDVVIPETIESEGQTFNVTKLQNNAFSHCSSITSLTSTGANLKNIGENAFYQCPNLTHVKFVGAEGAIIYDYAFYSCASLEEVNLNCSSIYRMAFANCANLQIVDLSGVKSIGYDQSVTVGRTYAQDKSIGSTFENCTNLSWINL